mgnify:CR=1 FL=1
MVSVIITTFNRPELLKRALKSVYNQTYKEYEIIVVDDCSENPVEGAIRHEVNKGLSAARNTGIKAAKGEYIVCLDDDNELLPKFLERAMATIGDNDALAVGRVIQYKDFEDYVVPGISPLSSIDWGWLVKKEVYNVIQYDEAMRANEDTDFGIQFFKRFKATQLDEPLTKAYDELGDPRKSLSFPTQRELDGMTYFFKKNAHEYTEPKDKWHLYRLMGRKFYRGGHRSEGLGYFLKGFLSYKTPRALLHLLLILPGWSVYNLFMTAEERIAAKRRS